MPRHLLATLAVAGLALTACGGGDDDATADTTPGTTADTTPATSPAVEPAETTSPVVEPVDTTVPVIEPPLTAAPTTAAEVELDPDAPDLGRVVALAEEFILADVMALGIEPIASSASVEQVGFQGMDEWDTSGIEVLPMTTLSLEYLASLEPDTIITLQFWVDQVGAEVLEGIADVIAIPDGLYGAERLATMGELVGRPEHAAAIAADLAAAEQQARDRVGEGCTLSLAAIYAGPAVAAFVDGPWDLPSAIQAAGCEIIPGPEHGPDANGRVWLSDEQLGLLDQDLLVLLQSDTVEGEADAIATIEQSPLWPTLPAVAAGNVVTFDRLGYMGTTGLIRFLDELGALLD